MKSFFSIFEYNDPETSTTTEGEGDTTTEGESTTPSEEETTTPPEGESEVVESGENGELTSDQGTTTTTTNIWKDKIFTTTNINLFIAFIFTYIVAYVVLGIFIRGKSDTNVTISYIIDIMVTIILLIILVTFYYSLDEESQLEVLKQRWEDTKDYIESDYSIIYQVGFILMFYTIIYLFRIPMSGGTKPTVIFLIETVAWLLLLFILTAKFFNIAFEVSLFDDMNKLFRVTPIAETPTTVNTEQPKPAVKKEVFNISGNTFTYNDAQAVCKAYGAELATYDQIEDAYNNGAEWCNYGWSANQMAYFPTQKQTWQKLQTNSKNKNACGRPGVNGGYMRNPNIRFGVNCYGTKPEAPKCALDKLSENGPFIPLTKEEKEIEEKVQYWKDNIGKCNVSSFNYNKWNSV